MRIILYKYNRIPRKSYFPLILIVFLLVFSFVIRIINLNYNSPFNDEAIYVVIGKMGVFQKDWWTYSSVNWVAGLPYIYPSLSALAYTSGGIIGTRFLNVVFGVLTVETIFVLTLLLKQQKRSHQGFDSQDYLAGVISSFIMAAAPVSLYVSRLATLDMPSFYFFLLGLVFLLYAEQRLSLKGKWYFLSSALLFLSFATKIIVAIYFPLIIIYSFGKAKKTANLVFWKRYFLAPLVLGLTIYGIADFSPTLTYLRTQAIREKVSAGVIIKTYLDHNIFVHLLWFIGSLGMLINREWRKWALLTFSAGLVLLVHLVLQREPTLDKHTFLSVSFLSVVAGIGISNLIFFFPKKMMRKFAATILATLMIIFAYISYIEAKTYSQLWENGSRVLSYLSREVKNGDKVLAEIGAAAILATYEKNYPVNITTFDWFVYRDLKEEEAYLSAIKDGYFDLIEVESDRIPKEEREKRLSQLLRKNLNENYQQSYFDDIFLVYKRIY